MKLLSDPDLEVQQMATAALCNMVLDFAVVKDVLVAAGCVDKLVSLATSMDSDLCLNAVWGLQNLAFQGSLEVKGSIMSALPWTTLTSLLRDESPELQVRPRQISLRLFHSPIHCLISHISIQYHVGLKFSAPQGSLKVTGSIVLGEPQTTYIFEGCVAQFAGAILARRLCPLPVISPPGNRAGSACLANLASHGSLGSKEIVDVGCGPGSAHPAALDSARNGIGTQVSYTFTSLASRPYQTGLS